VWYEALTGRPGKIHIALPINSDTLDYCLSTAAEVGRVRERRAGWFELGDVPAPQAARWARVIRIPQWQIPGGGHTGDICVPARIYGERVPAGAMSLSTAATSIIGRVDEGRMVGRRG
jgi:hypothetical protein